MLISHSKLIIEFLFIYLLNKGSIQTSIKNNSTSTLSIYLIYHLACICFLYVLGIGIGIGSLSHLLWGVWAVWLGSSSPLLMISFVMVTLNPFMKSHDLLEAFRRLKKLEVITFCPMNYNVLTLFPHELSIITLEPIKLPSYDIFPLLSIK
jgi:hypothetical protein